MKDIDTLLNIIKHAVIQKGFIMNSNERREEKAKKLALLSNKIRNAMIGIRLYIDKTYFEDFVNGHTVTIPPDDRIRFDISSENIEDYIEVRCNFWGPCDDFLYFMSKIRIVVVDEEAYVLRGDYDKLMALIYGFLGGRKQNEDFKTFRSLEANTHQNAVRFCNKLVNAVSHFENYENYDNTMSHHTCILQNNFFPALALADIYSSSSSDIKKWSKIFSEILRELLKFYDPQIVLGQRDNLGYASLEYSGVFNRALAGMECFKLLGENQTILGRQIIDAEKINTGRNKCAGVIDEKGTIWIGYTYFSRPFWNGAKGDNIINWIKNKYWGLHLN